MHFCFVLGWLRRGELPPLQGSHSPMPGCLLAPVSKQWFKALYSSSYRPCISITTTLRWDLQLILQVLLPIPNYLSRFFSLSTTVGGHLTWTREKGHKLLSNKNGYSQYCKTWHRVSWEIKCKVNLTQMKSMYEDLFLVLFFNLFSPLSNDAYLG